MEIMYLEHGNLQLLAKEVNGYLSGEEGGTWKPLDSVKWQNGRWVQCLVKE